jgi:hypothetical protein
MTHHDNIQRMTSDLNFGIAFEWLAHLSCLGTFCEITGSTLKHFCIGCRAAPGYRRSAANPPMTHHDNYSE